MNSATKTTKTPRIETIEIALNRGVVCLDTWRAAMRAIIKATANDR